MLAFFNLIGGIKGVIYVLIIAAAAGWIYTQKAAVADAEKARDAAIAAQGQLQLQLDKAIEVSRINSETIARLEEEKADVQAALNQKDAARGKNAQNTARRNATIDSQASVDANKTPIAPVLKSVLADIQADRQARRAPQASK